MVDDVHKSLYTYAIKVILCDEVEAMDYNRARKCGQNII